MKYTNHWTKALKFDIFLDISNAFDNVWHEGLIFELKQRDIPGNLLNILCDFLRNRKRRVLVNGKISEWSNVKADVCLG